MICSYVGKNPCSLASIKFQTINLPFVMHVSSMWCPTQTGVISTLTSLNTKINVSTLRFALLQVIIWLWHQLDSILFWSTHTGTYTCVVFLHPYSSYTVSYQTQFEYSPGYLHVCAVLITWLNFWYSRFLVGQLDI